MTMKFRNFQAAEEFASKSGKYGSRPYRRLIWIDGVQVPIWCVTLAITAGGQ